MIAGEKNVIWAFLFTAGECKLFQFFI